MAGQSEDERLLAALGVAVEPVKARKYTPREERIVAGFEDIQHFYDEHHRAPEHGEDRDIFERLYAVRLDRLRALPEARALLAPLDSQGLMSQPIEQQVGELNTLDDAALLASLSAGAQTDGDITALRHVRSSSERRTVGEIAERARCADFERFQPLFDQVAAELSSGLRESLPFGRDASIDEGDFFVLGGQLVYVAEVGESMKAPNGESDARLRLVYANATESNLLKRSLQRALYKDEAGRRVTAADDGPLFADRLDDGDVESGTIYVLRSLSTDAYVMQHRELIHKIGVTAGDVETRVASAEHDATYMLAGVEIVATYKLSSIRPFKLEALLHRIFAPAQLDITIQDRFGHPVHPREWFLVPLTAIDAAVERIRDGTITKFRYDPATARLMASGLS